MEEGGSWRVRTVGAQHVKNADSSEHLMVGESRELYGWLDLHFFRIMFYSAVRYGVFTIKDTGTVSEVRCNKELSVCIIRLYSCIHV